MFADTASLLKNARRRLWMKYALRGVGGNDNHQGLDLAYRMEDPWNMDSPMERARFEATAPLACVSHADDNDPGPRHRVRTGHRFRIRPFHRSLITFLRCGHNTTPLSPIPPRHRSRRFLLTPGP